MPNTIAHCNAGWHAVRETPTTRRRHYVASVFMGAKSFLRPAPSKILPTPPKPFPGLWLWSATKTTHSVLLIVGVEQCRHRPKQVCPWLVTPLPINLQTSRYNRPDLHWIKKMASYSLDDDGLLPSLLPILQDDQVELTTDQLNSLVNTRCDPDVQSHNLLSVIVSDRIPHKINIAPFNTIDWPFTGVLPKKN